MTQVWFKNRRVKWKKEMRDWCSSEKYRFTACLYENSKFPKAIPPNDSSWTAADGHTMPTSKPERRGLAPHSSNELWHDRNQNIIQATSSSYSGNLWLPCKDLKFPKFPSPSDSTFLHNGVNMLCDAGTMRAKDLLCGAKSSNLLNCNEIPDPAERNVLSSGARVTDSRVTRGSSYNGSTSVLKGNIWSSGENLCLSQKYTQFSSPILSQGLYSGHSSVMRNARRLDRDTLQPCAKVNTLQNCTRFSNPRKIKVLDKDTMARSEMSDAEEMHSNTGLSFRRKSFFQSCAQSHPTANKNMNSGADMMRGSSVVRNPSVILDPGVNNGITCLSGDIGIVSQNYAQFSGPTEHEAFYRGTSVMHDTSFKRDRHKGVINGNSWLPDENLSLSQKYFKFSSSTESEAFPNDANRMLHSSLTADATAIRETKMINENTDLPGENARLYEICTEYRDPFEMHCVRVCCNAGLTCDAQPSSPNLSNSLTLTNEGDKAVLEREREEEKMPWMNLPATKAFDLTEDTLNLSCVPCELQMQDMNDHDSTVLDDLMAIINEDELKNP